MADRSVAVGPRRGSLADRLAPRPIVLVVEDEADIATFLGAYFRASGLDLVHVNPRSIEDVAAAALAHRPGCILLDLGLAGLSGLDLLADARQRPETAGVPVVVVTGDVRQATRTAATAGGATAFVAKPFDVRDLFAQVDQLVTTRVGRT